MTKERTSNFEILRIISMCGIIAIHYLSGTFGGMAGNAVFPKFSWFFSQFINSVACPLVNCFVLISGYFLVKQDKFGIRKSIDLLIISAFYGIIGYLIGIATNNVGWSIKSLFFSIFPFFAGRRWFVETYIILILLVPFINKTLCKLDKNSFKILLFIQLGVFCVWYSLGLSSPLLDNGYGITNFITLYLVGAYFKLFGVDSIFFNLSKAKLLLGYASSTLLTFALSYFIYPFGYAFITIIIGSICIFCFFAKVDIGCNKKINAISSAAFDVYFVHSDIYTSKLLIFELLRGKLFVGTVWMIPHLIVVTTLLYLLGMIFSKVRKSLFSISVNRLLDHSNIINITKII